MGPIGIALIILLGIVAPFVTIVVLPMRALYIFAIGPMWRRVCYLMLLLPWLYYLIPILKHGYVSQTSIGTGPTVNPHVWILLAVCWFIVEVTTGPHTTKHSTAREVDSQSATTIPLNIEENEQR